MIKWQDVGKLHVVNKLSEILGNHFELEMFYTDAHGKLWSDHDKKGLSI